eukprot:sb/3469154/
MGSKLLLHCQANALTTVLALPLFERSENREYHFICGKVVGGLLSCYIAIRFTFACLRRQNVLFSSLKCNSNLPQLQTGYQPIRDQYFLIRSVPDILQLFNSFSHSLYRSLYLYLSLSFSHTHTLSLSLSIAHYLYLSLSLSLSPSPLHPRQTLKKIIENKLVMGDVMKAVYFSLAEAAYSAGDITQTVIQNADKAQNKIKFQRDNVAGVQLTNFTMHTEGSDNYQLTGVCEYWSLIG